MQRNYSLKHLQPSKSKILRPKNEVSPALITAAFGLIAALAWNPAIQALILLYIGTGNALMGLFIYAIIVTIIALIATYAIARSLAKYGVEMPKK
ncbi:DUF5654 family protein [Methanobacterium sp.]|jgi:hypothetical protein|uniref:DUF5654 family protein n=1 Tax=Methanobacterium sp. TaxID=2164 RepID=UPI0031581549